MNCRSSSGRSSRWGTASSAITADYDVWPDINSAAIDRYVKRPNDSMQDVLAGGVVIEFPLTRIAGDWASRT